MIATSCSCMCSRAVCMSARAAQPRLGGVALPPPVKLASPHTQSIKEFWQTFVDKQVGRQPTHLLSG